MVIKPLPCGSSAGNATVAVTGTVTSTCLVGASSSPVTVTAVERSEDAM